MRDLKARRLKAGLTQLRLAQLIPGCTPGYISKIENGSLKPDDGLLARLDLALGGKARERTAEEAELADLHEIYCEKYAPEKLEDRGLWK